MNRRIFAESQKKRRELNYKYIWTQNGTTHLRKDDGSEIITINGVDEINTRL